MRIEIEFSFKKALETLKKSPEMKTYIVMNFILLMFLIFTSYLIAPLIIGSMVATQKMLYFRPEFYRYILIYLLFNLIISLISLFIQALVIKSTYDHLKGSSSFDSSVKRAFQIYPSLLGASFLYSLTLSSPFLLLFLAILHPALCCLSILLIPFLTIYVGMRLVFFSYPIVLFKRKAMEGLKESWEITEGRFIEIFIFYIVLSLIIFIISVPFSPFIWRYAEPPVLVLVSVISSIVSSILGIWVNIVMTLAYLQLRDIYGRNGFVTKIGKSGRSPGTQTILLIGFSTEEIGKISVSGLPVYPISEDAKDVKMKEILMAPHRYSGDSGWTAGKYAIIHGFKGEEISKIIETINSSSTARVRYATSTDTSLEWTLWQLLKELSEV